MKSSRFWTTGGRSSFDVSFSVNCLSASGSVQYGEADDGSSSGHLFLLLARAGTNGSVIAGRAVEGLFLSVVGCAHRVPDDLAVPGRTRGACKMGADSYSRKRSNDRRGELGGENRRSGLPDSPNLWWLRGLAGPGALV